ncbi:hypothetical protein DFP72DRAFT_1040417 [Ephemerocybe angulata]|uniref:Uncharacterized protein n=1 Tax=Ephemerocybe angulata TaxID=980116 RepID=A0A8H6MGF6_9AGAR|nr:hypothetical protein DFP72DRAFT_1040417 [Tulosesus angulatus]
MAALARSSDDTPHRRFRPKTGSSRNGFLPSRELWILDYCPSTLSSFLSPLAKYAETTLDSCHRIYIYPAIWLALRALYKLKAYSDRTHDQFNRTMEIILGGMDRYTAAWQIELELSHRPRSPPPHAMPFLEDGNTRHLVEGRERKGVIKLLRTWIRDLCQAGSPERMDRSGKKPRSQNRVRRRTYIAQHLHRALTPPPPQRQYPNLGAHAPSDATAGSESRPFLLLSTHTSTLYGAGIPQYMELRVHDAGRTARTAHFLEVVCNEDCKKTSQELSLGRVWVGIEPTNQTITLPLYARQTYRSMFLTLEKRCSIEKGLPLLLTLTFRIQVPHTPYTIWYKHYTTPYLSRKVLRRMVGLESESPSREEFRVFASTRFVRVAGFWGRGAVLLPLRLRGRTISVLHIPYLHHPRTSKERAEILHLHVIKPRQRLDYKVLIEKGATLRGGEGLREWTRGKVRTFFAKIELRAKGKGGRVGEGGDEMTDNSLRSNLI